jgi:hypothetical protein
MFAWDLPGVGKNLQDHLHCPLYRRPLQSCPAQLALDFLSPAQFEKREACLSTFSKQVQLGEVGERVGEAIDRIDHHYGDPGGPNIGQEVLQGRAIEGGTREPAIVVAIRNQAPVLMRLALDRGLAGLALGIARVEGEIEIPLGRFAGVDRAAEDFSFGGRHRCAFAWGVETRPPCHMSRERVRTTHLRLKWANQ